MADQFRTASKLPYMQWIFLDAPDNRDAMQQAWYTPTGLPSIAPSRPELADPEDEYGMMRTVNYVISIIDGLVSEGIPAKRVVLGGFSQGHAITLLTGLISQYSGKLAGLVALSGYLPLVDRIDDLRTEARLPKLLAERPPVFMVRGKADIAIPKRYLHMQMEKLRELGYTDEEIELHEYECLQHTSSGQELRDLCIWLEKILPPIDE